MSNTKKNIGMICTILSALLFGFSPVIVQFVKDFGISTITVVFYRNFFCIFITLLWTLFSKQNLKVSKKHLIQLALISIFGVSLATLTLYSSYNYIGVGTATVLHFLFPIFAVALSIIFIREKIFASRIIALVCSLIGLLFFLQGSADMTGIILAVVSAVAYAIYLVGMQKTGISKLESRTVAFYFALFGSISMGAYGTVTNELQIIIPFEALALCLVISFLTSFGAVILLQIGVRELNATTASLLCLFEPISGVIFGIVFLSEVVTTNQWIGSAIIILALLIDIIMGKKSIETAHSN